MNSVNCSLLAAGKTTLSSVDVGKLVRLAFGSTVERRSARVQGCRSYVYCGIRRKSDHEESPTKRSCIQETSKDITSPTSDHLLRITQLEAELKREKKRTQDLEAEPQQSIIQSQSIQWHQVGTEINAELNALQRAGGIMSTGPVDAADAAPSRLQIA